MLFVQIIVVHTMLIKKSGNGNTFGGASWGIPFETSPSSCAKLWIDGFILYEVAVPSYGWTAYSKCSLSISKYAKTHHDSKTKRFTRMHSRQGRSEVLVAEGADGACSFPFPIDKLGKTLV